jgi:hypothetical protein
LELATSRRLRVLDLEIVGLHVLGLEGRQFLQASARPHAKTCGDAGYRGSKVSTAIASLVNGINLGFPFFVTIKVISRRSRSIWVQVGLSSSDRRMPVFTARAMIERIIGEAEAISHSYSFRLK